MRAFLVTYFAILCFSLTGCHKQEDSSQAHLEQKKARIAVAPVIDLSKHRLSWNVASEITTNIYESLAQKNCYQLVAPSKLKKLSKNQDPFSSDLSWVKQLFPEQEFVCFTTLLEHSEKPSYAEEEVSISDSPTDLKISLQVRIIDLREETPKIVLDKTFEKIQHIPRQFSCFNFTQVAWGQPMYTFSPIGVVHAELTDDIIHQIEEAVLK